MQFCVAVLHDIGYFSASLKTTEVWQATFFNTFSALPHGHTHEAQGAGEPGPSLARQHSPVTFPGGYFESAAATIFSSAAMRASRVAT